MFALSDLDERTSEHDPHPASHVSDLDERSSEHVPHPASHVYLSRDADDQVGHAFHDVPQQHSVRHQLGHHDRLRESS